MKFKVELEREYDGCWIAEVPELPGVLAYGTSPSEAQAKVQAVALRVVADLLEPRLGFCSMTQAPTGLLLIQEAYSRSRSW